jgi:hypothetical protein
MLANSNSRIIRHVRADRAILVRSLSLTQYAFEASNLLPVESRAMFEVSSDIVLEATRANTGHARAKMGWVSAPDVRLPPR